DPRRRSVARGDLFNKDHTRWLHHDSTVGEGGNGIHHHVPGALACTTGNVHVDPVLELDLVGGGKPVRVKTAGGAYHLTGTQRTNRGEDDGRGPVLAREHAARSAGPLRHGSLGGGILGLERKYG